TAARNGCAPRRGNGGPPPLPRRGVRRADVHIPAPLRRRSGSDAARARAGRPARRNDRITGVRAPARVVAVGVGALRARPVTRRGCADLPGVERSRELPWAEHSRLLRTL